MTGGKNVMDTLLKQFHDTTQELSQLEGRQFEDTPMSGFFMEALQGLEAPEPMDAPPQRGAGGLGALGAIAAAAQGPAAVARQRKGIESSYQQRLRVEQANKGAERDFKQQRLDLKAKQAEAQSRFEERMQRRRDRLKQEKAGLERGVAEVADDQAQQATAGLPSDLTEGTNRMLSGVWNHLMTDPSQPLVDEQGVMLAPALTNEAVAVEGYIDHVTSNIRRSLAPYMSEHEENIEDMIAGVELQLRNTIMSKLEAGGLPTTIDSSLGPDFGDGLSAEEQAADYARRKSHYKAMIPTHNVGLVSTNRQYSEPQAEFIAEASREGMKIGSEELDTYLSGDLVDLQTEWQQIWAAEGGPGIYPGLNDYERGARHLLMLEEKTGRRYAIEREKPDISRAGDVMGVEKKIDIDKNSPWRWNGNEWQFDPRKAYGELKAPKSADSGITSVSQARSMESLRQTDTMVTVANLARSLQDELNNYGANPFGPEPTETIDEDRNERIKREFTGEGPVTA